MASKLIAMASKPLDFKDPTTYRSGDQGTTRTATLATLCTEMNTVNKALRGGVPKLLETPIADVRPQSNPVTASRFASVS